LRYVKYDPIKLKYPKNWKKDAAAALKELKAAAPKDRAKIIKKHSKLWAALKTELSKVFHDKCWYTEAPQSMAGTDSDVDHFRPKKAVKGVKKAASGEKHPGYWWLAFDPTNYKFSCIYANRARKDIATGKVGGKVDEFPISNETKRCWCDTDDINNEQPLLINPCKQTEVALLMFADNGEVISRYTKKQKPRLFAKADTSRRLYNLNYSGFVKARLAIREDIMGHIEDAQRYYNKLETADPDMEHAFERAIEGIHKACSIDAPFSSFALSIMEAHKGKDCFAGLHFSN
jgi:hypothetical protein